MTILLQVEALSKTFLTRNTEVKVFADASFTLNTGEVMVVTGRSGEGKSTLLGLLSGLERPTNGRILFQGNDITMMSMAQLAELRAGSIGMIFQSFNLIPNWTALENVEAVLMHRGLKPDELRNRATSILGELGLKDRLQNLPGELSVGQQQRVAVARTLVNEPVLILADEPTGDVDPETAAEIINLLLPRVKKSGTALIVATHGSFDCSCANKVLNLKGGKLSEIKTSGGDFGA